MLDLSIPEIDSVDDLPKAASPGTTYRIKLTHQRYCWVDNWVQIFDPDANRIICAANKYPNGMIVPGVRHHDMIMYDIAMHSDIAKTDDQPIQGFLDKYGAFHDRKAAWVIAFNAGQIVRRVGGDDKGILYSENLY